MAKPARLSKMLDVDDPPLVDVRLARDNRIFIDPSAVRASAKNKRSRYAAEADRRPRCHFRYMARATQTPSQTPPRQSVQ